MKKILLSCVSFLLCWIMISSPVYAHTENASNKLYSKNEITEDVKTLVDKLERIHPNLYFSITKEEFHKEINETLNSITKPMSKVDFFKKFAPIMSKIQDGHTTMNLPENFTNEIMCNENLIPIIVKVGNGRLYLKDILTKELKGKYMGYEIISINNKDSNTLYSQMIKYTFGKQISFKELTIEKQFTMLYHLTNDFNSSYELKLKNSIGTEINITIKGMTFNSIKKIFCDSYNSSKETKFYEYKVLDNKIALINFNSCTDLDGFKKFLDTSFKDMKEKGISDLIVDIRRNGGGSSNLSQLLVEYIYGGKYKTVFKSDIKISKEILDYYSKYLSKEDLENFKKQLGSAYTFDCKPTRDYIDKPVFNGNTYFLIGTNTFSSAVMLANIVKDYHIGYLIGEETGGLATHYGDIYSFNLPNTNLSIGVSHKYFVRPNGLDTHRGVLPDYYEKDLGKDALDIAKDIIMNKRK